MPVSGSVRNWFDRRGTSGSVVPVCYTAFYLNIVGDSLHARVARGSFCTEGLTIDESVSRSLGEDALRSPVNGLTPLASMAISYSNPPVCPFSPFVLNEVERVWAKCPSETRCEVDF